MLRSCCLLIDLAGIGGSASAQEVEATRHLTAEVWAAGTWLLSLPYAGTLEDVANSTLSDPCDLSAAWADGDLNADDLICSFWGGGDLARRFGAINVQNGDWGCATGSRTAFRPALGREPIFVGASFPYEPDAGFAIRLIALPGQPIPDDVVTFGGPCEPTLPPEWIAPGGREWRLLSLSERYARSPRALKRKTAYQPSRGFGECCLEWNRVQGISE